MDYREASYACESGAQGCRVVRRVTHVTSRVVQFSQTRRAPRQMGQVTARRCARACSIASPRVEGHPCDAGHRLLEEMRERLRAFKRNAPVDHTAPAIDAG